MHSGPSGSDSLATSTTKSSDEVSVDASAASSESIEELLERVLHIQAEYADRPVHSFEEFLRLIRTW